jgi:Na+-transporting NADH:ubiquinone oxidoreductase subunit NqrC
MQRYKNQHRKNNFHQKMVTIIFVCFCSFSLLSGMMVCLSKSPAQKSSYYLDLAIHYQAQQQRSILSAKESVAAQYKVDALLKQAKAYSPHDPTIAKEITRLKMAQPSTGNDKRFFVVRAE